MPLSSPASLAVDMGPVEVMSKFRTLASGKVPARGYVPPAVAKAIRNKLAFAVPLMYRASQYHQYVMSDPTAESIVMCEYSQQ